LVSRRAFQPKSLPGPPKIPLLGNRIPTDVKIWEAFKNWSKEFGPAFSIRILSVDIVVVNTIESCREFFEARSNVYSGRQAPKMAELAGMFEGILFQPDSSRLRAGRKFLAAGLQPGTMKAFYPVLHRNNVIFLNRVLAEPAKILDIIPTLPTGVSLEIAYGYQATGLDDPFVKRARTSIERFTAATALSLKEGFIVNWLPFLALLPGTSFKKTAAEWQAWTKATAAEGLNMVKEELRNGTARPSLLQKALEAKTYDDVVLMRTAAQVYSGGSDTTSSAIKTFVLAMTLHPEVQAKAQAEIDRHMANKGAGRLPNYISDRDDLPYTLAILREVMRWHGPAPLTSRTAVEDNVYEGCLIKKGTMIMVNMWAILHDENVFPDHEAFRPERWMDGTILEKYDVDPFDVAFGFGRRVCPGKYLAIDVMFTAVASLLAVFNITKAKDSDGNEIVPKEEYSNRAIIAPFPFPCVVTTRSKAAEQLVDNAVSALA